MQEQSTEVPAITSSTAVHTPQAPPPSAAAAGAASSTAPLPAGWFEAFDPTYRTTYWYNPNTGERSWERPRGPVAQSAGELILQDQDQDSPTPGSGLGSGSQ